MARRHTDESREEAVRIALTSRLTRKQVAAALGIGFSTLEKWVEENRKDPDRPATHSDLERELVDLRKEDRLLREEIL